MKTFEDFREEHPNIGAFVSIKSDGIAKVAIANMFFCEKLGKAVMKNKKFRAVLEYDPEELNSTFYVEFDEPGIHLDASPGKEPGDVDAKRMAYDLHKILSSTLNKNS